jgi:signal transduction histidine kinase
MNASYRLHEKQMTTPPEVKKSQSFQRKLALALAALGAVAAVQGILAIWAVTEVGQHVWRGRVAADIKIGFIQLSLDKQRLRNWMAQRQFNAGADEQQRDALLERMEQTIVRLKDLAEQAKALDAGPAARARQAQRTDALLVLDISLAQLRRGLASLNAPAIGTDTTAAWQLANDIFDRAEGSDLRRLLSESMQREDTALREKRAETDDAVARLQLAWIASTAAIVMAALLLAVGFARGLRRPIQYLAEGAAAIREGRLDHRIPIESSDEFATVAKSMNVMAQELAIHRQREIDTRHALEQEVALRTAELSAALEAQREMEARRRQLFADVSHELRTPTTAIRGEAQVTLRGADKPLDEYKSSLRRIEDAARQLGRSIDDLLTMARSDIDALALHRTAINLSDVLNDAFSNGVAMARTAGVTLSHEPWPASLFLDGDADRLRQLLLTLIDNAIRYSRAGDGVRIAVHRSGAHIEVQIIDQGIGIPEEELSKVFNRSHRAPNAVRYRSDGSGLGLPIARALARAHGGDISISSAAGQGTVASVTLPLSVAASSGAA